MQATKKKQPSIKKKKGPVTELRIRHCALSEIMQVQQQVNRKLAGTATLRQCHISGHSALPSVTQKMNANEVAVCCQ